MIYVFCKSCEPEIALQVLQIKTKAILTLQLVNQQRIDRQISRGWSHCIVVTRPFMNHCALPVKFHD